MAKSIVAITVCAAAMAVAAACAADDDLVVPPTGAVALSDSVPSVTRTATPTATSDPTGTPPAPAGTTITRFGRFRSPGDPTPLTAADANVDRARFHNYGGQGAGYFFQSPSGNVRCGIGFPDPYTPAGCQATVSVRSTTGVQCGNDGGRTAYVSELVRDAVRNYCTSRSVYVGSDESVADQPLGFVGGRVLGYGQVISAGGVTCASSTGGITCFQGPSEFTLSRDRNLIY